MKMTIFDIKERRIPFDIKPAFKDHTLKSLMTDLSKLAGGTTEAIYWIAGSLDTELIEQEILLLNRDFNLFNSGKTSETFVRQEGRHSGYHHICNNCITTKKVDPEFGPRRINKAIYHTFASREVNYRLAYEAKTPQDKEEMVKHFAQWVATFEALFGIVTATAVFQHWEKMIDAVMESNPIWAYIWLYHLAEELEHSPTAIVLFEEKYGEPIWSPSNLPATKEIMESFFNNWYTIAAHVADLSDVKFSVSKMEELPIVKMEKAGRKQLIDTNFDFSYYNEERKKYISLYDNVWEPKLRKICEVELKKITGQERKVG